VLSQRRTVQQADQLFSVRGDEYQPDGGRLEAAVAAR